MDRKFTRLPPQASYGYLFFIACLVLLAILEGWNYFFGQPRLPFVFAAVLAVLAVAIGIQIRRERHGLGRGHLGADAERMLEQMQDDLRAGGATLFRDVPGDGFHLEQVVVSDRGVLVLGVEVLANAGEGAITFEGAGLHAAGRRLRHDLLTPLRAQIRWLANLLEQLTGENLPVRGALVLPGRRCELAPEAMGGNIWVLEPQALPQRLRLEPVCLSDEQVSRCTIYLGNFIRRQNETAQGNS